MWPEWQFSDQAPKTVKYLCLISLVLQSTSFGASLAKVEKRLKAENILCGGSFRVEHACRTIWEAACAGTWSKSVAPCQLCRQLCCARRQIST